MKIEERLKELGIELPEATTPMGSYVNAVRTGNLLFMAGKGPGLPGKPLPVGKVGRDFSLEQANRFARDTGLSILAALKAELGDLDRVKRIVKVLGMVNATSEYGSQPEVINGCSDLFVEVFGEKGRHARSAVGMAHRPRRAGALRHLRRPLRRRDADAADPRSREGLQRGQGRPRVPAPN
jgi:enamine deaminase RidA (YjgF/YER057c/UK114 family)